MIAGIDLSQSGRRLSEHATTFSCPNCGHQISTSPGAWYGACSSCGQLLFKREPATRSREQRPSISRPGCLYLAELVEEGTSTTVTSPRQVPRRCRRSGRNSVGERQQDQDGELCRTCRRRAATEAKRRTVPEGIYWTMLWYGLLTAAWATSLAVGAMFLFGSHSRGIAVAQLGVLAGCIIQGFVVAGLHAGNRIARSVASSFAAIGLCASCLAAAFICGSCLGLFTLNGFAWLPAAFLIYSLAVAMPALHVFILSTLQSSPARIHFGLACPRCGSSATHATDLRKSTMTCRNCRHRWR